MPALIDIPNGPSLDVERARFLITTNNCGEPVGYQAKRALEAPICHDGCLAPGSSPHSHPNVVGFLLVGTTGFVETDADLMPYRVATLHPLVLPPPAAPIPTEFEPDEKCFVCDKPVSDGDEPGWTQMDNGVWVANCSTACAKAFYAEDKS